MNPSLRTISDAIENLRGLAGSPAMFQRLAETYAQLKYPQRFRELIPHGRNVEGLTVGGWPDAYSLLPDGRIYGMEATLQQDWRAHLRKDLESAREVCETGGLAGFVFVAGAEGPERDVEDVWRKKFVDLGIPAEDVIFIFKKQLCRDLCQPRFARIWTDPLGLRADCFPFQHIRDVEGLFGAEESMALFAPTLQEFEHGTVHRSAVLPVVVEHMQREGWAWVRGKGATGKTVLATQIALDHEKKTQGPAYYVDLAGFDEAAYITASDIFEVLSTRADAATLFVIDNVHLEPLLASRIQSHWETFGSGSRLLMLGRFQELGDPERGARRPLQHLLPDALTLTNSAKDLLGVYGRLAKRREPPLTNKPPPDALRRWEETFGGDLIVFSAAVSRRLDAFAQGDWRLHAEDARDQIRGEYLVGDAATKRNILRIAAMTSIELLAPEEALDRSALEEPMRSGRVLCSHHKRTRHRRYRLVHAGLGDLVLASTAERVSTLALFKEIVARHPWSAGAISYRLEKLRDIGKARAVLEELEPEGIVNMLTAAGLSMTRQTIQLLERLDVFTIQQVDHLLAGSPSEEETHKRRALETAALRTPLNDLVDLLRYVENHDRLTGVYEAVVDVLEAPDSRDELARTALQTPLDLLAFFLRYVEGQDRLSGVFEAVVGALEAPEGCDELSRKALHSPLEHLAHFLRYSQEENRLPNFVTGFRQLDLEQWRHALQARLPQPQEPEAFLTLARQLSGLDRTDLADLLAGWILESFPTLHSGSCFYLQHLNSLLYHGRECQLRVLKRVCQRVATQEWLKELYSNAQPGTIAGCLFWIWWYNPDLIRYFHHPQLGRFLRREASRMPVTAGERLNGKLRLLGVADLLRLPVTRLPLRAPSFEGLASAFVPAQESIGHLQSTFWLGLRCLSRCLKTTIKVPEEQAQQDLEVWRKTEAETERQEAFNRWMVTWLADCAENGWELVRDEGRFRFV